LGFEFRVWGLAFGVSGFELAVSALGLGLWVIGFELQVSGFGFGFGVSGLRFGFRV